MDETALLAAIGRRQLEIEDRAGQYDRLLELLAKVISGEIDRSRVLVNLTDRTWAVAPEGMTPGTPATVNGLPKVVVGIPDPPPGDGLGEAPTIEDLKRAADRELPGAAG